MKERLIKILYWAVLVVLVGGMAIQLSSEEFDTVRPIEGDGTYLLHPEELIPREDVDIMVVGDRKIHLFYIDNELEKLFTGEYPHTDGEYLYTYVAENNKVIRSGNGVTEDILQFPKKSFHYGAFLLLFGFFVLAGCEYEKLKHPFG